MLSRIPAIVMFLAFSTPITVGGLVVGEGLQIISQLISMAVVLAWALVTGFALFFALKFTMGVRVTREEELEGLDISEHNLPAYDETPLAAPSGADD